MARFRTEGLDDLIRDMEDLGEHMGEISEEMLMAGAEEVAQSWKDAIRKHNIIDTASMLNDVYYPRRPKTIRGIKQIDIYPQGMSAPVFTGKDGKTYRRSGLIRNAEKAFITHYGVRNRTGKRKLSTYKIQPTYFVDDADEMSGPRVEERLYRIWNQHLIKRNL